MSSLTFCLDAPGGLKRNPYVDPAKDTGHFVKALILNNPAGATMHGFAEQLSNDEYCEVWSKVQGVTARPLYLNYDDLIAAGTPRWLALEIYETGIYLAKYGQMGGDSEYKEPRELGVNVGKLTTVEMAIREDDWSSVL